MAPDTEHAPIVVEVSDTQRHLRIDHQALKCLVRAALVAEGVEGASISVAVVDDATIRAINHRYLDHDWPTDVISFRLSEEGGPVLHGELIVSAEMAATTALAAGADPWHELALYVVHGLLHLCGYDDRTDEDRLAIRRREDEILAREGLTNTFPLVGLGEAAVAERESVRWPA